jgi:hypothetical protein
MSEIDSISHFFTLVSHTNNSCLGADQEMIEIVDAKISRTNERYRDFFGTHD